MILALPGKIEDLKHKAMQRPIGANLGGCRATIQVKRNQFGMRTRSMPLWQLCSGTRKPTIAKLQKELLNLEAEFALTQARTDGFNTSYEVVQQIVEKNKFGPTMW